MILDWDTLLAQQNGHYVVEAGTLYIYYPTSLFDNAPKVVIRFSNGRKVITGNLVKIGAIPAQHQKSFPNNAIIIRRKQWSEKLTRTK